MRQHVNPLSKNFCEVQSIPSLNQIFEYPKSPLHLDIGCASGEFLFELASSNKDWNYLGIEIREKLIINAKLRLKRKEIENLYFSFGNANKMMCNYENKSLIHLIDSISFNFPDPWFKKKHHKRRVIQSDFVNLLSKSMKKGSLIFIKTDVKELFDYMEDKILDNISFKKLENKGLQLSYTFNPSQIQTAREKYAISNKLEIYESIYKKM